MIKVYEYYNTNPLNKNVGDCVIRAISKALNQSWEDTYIDLCIQGLYMADMIPSDNVWGAYLKRKGYKHYLVPNTCPDCYTIADFAADYPTGLFIVGTGKHVVCIKDGVIYDSWDSSNEVPTHYFTKD